MDVVPKEAVGVPGGRSQLVMNLVISAISIIFAIASYGNYVPNWGNIYMVRF